MLAYIFKRSKEGSHVSTGSTLFPVRRGNRATHSCLWNSSNKVQGLQYEGIQLYHTVCNFLDNCPEQFLVSCSGATPKKLLGVAQLEVRRQQSQPGAMSFMTETHLSWLTQWNKRLGGHTGLRDANSIDSKDADLIGHTFNHLLGLKHCFFAEIEIQPHPSGALFLFPLNEIPWRGHKMESGFSLASKSKLCQIECSTIS